VCVRVRECVCESVCESERERAHARVCERMSRISVRCLPEVFLGMLASEPMVQSIWIFGLPAWVFIQQWPWQC